MKKPRLKLDQSEGFVLGIAIDFYEIQIGFIAWIITVKFRK